jgi:hypothetical protein
MNVPVVTNERLGCDEWNRSEGFVSKNRYYSL